MNRTKSETASRQRALREIRAQLRKLAGLPPEEPEITEAQRRALRHGGQRINQGAAAVTLYQRVEKKLERITYLDHETYARPVWSIRNLTPGQRATATRYGYLVEFVAAGGSSVFLKERVSGGLGPQGGEALAHKARLVEVARNALRTVPPITYGSTGRGRRPAGNVGPHKPIPAEDLVDAIAVHGASVEDVARRFGWEAEQAGRMVAPTRQRSRITEGLAEALDAIAAEWAGWHLPGGDGGESIEVG